jgi:hypothetical protein
LDINIVFIYFEFGAAKTDNLFAIPIKAGVGRPLSRLRFVQLEKNRK